MKTIVLPCLMLSSTWLILRFGFPKEPVMAINSSTYSLPFAAVAMLGIAGAAFVALRRMR